MKTLVVYDSVFGNSEKIAIQIAHSLQTEPVQVGKVNDTLLAGVDLLVVGSPTRAFKPTPSVVAWVEGLPSSQLGPVKFAAFDTRMNAKASKNPLMRFVDMMGYAGPWIQKKLSGKGFQVVKPAEGFFVEDSKGPLKAGELERAAAWATSLLK